MHERRSLEIAWETFEEEIAPWLPQNGDRHKALQKIASLSAELTVIMQSVQEDPFLKNSALRYFGLHPLKISALNLAHSLQADEHHFLSLYLQLTHRLILTNILRLRLMPHGSKKLHTQFSAQELAYFPAALELMEALEKDLEEEHTELQAKVDQLRREYEMFLFVESSHEASRSFGAKTPDILAHHTSWVAFAQLLTGVAVHVHEEQKAGLIRKSRRIEAKRDALFESCAELFAKASQPGDAKKIYRKLSTHLAEIKKLEVEIETTLAELSVPGLHDYASFIMKKNPDGSKTSELNNISQRTGGKT